MLIVIIDENVDFVMKLSMKLKGDPFVVVIVFWYTPIFRKVHKERRLQGPFQTKQIIGMLFLGWFFHPPSIFKQPESKSRSDTTK